MNVDRIFDIDTYLIKFFSGCIVITLFLVALYIFKMLIDAVSNIKI